MKLSILFLLIHLLFSTLYAQEEETDTEQTTQEEISYIKVIDITKKSVEILTALGDAEKILQESQEAKDMHNALPPYVQTIDRMLENENFKNPQEQTVRELQKMRSELVIYMKQFAEWSSIVQEDIKKYDAYKVKIKAQILLWDATYVNAQKEGAPQSIQNQILSVLTETNIIDNDLKIKYDRALTSSQMITINNLKLQNMKKELLEIEQVATNRVFFKNQDSLMQLFSSETFNFPLYIQSVIKSIHGKYDESRSYIITNKELWLNLSIVSSLLLSFIIFYNYLYRKKRLFVRKESLQKEIFFFIGRPVATFILLFILSVIFIFAHRPAALTELIVLVMFIPVVRILQTAIKREYHKYIYFVCLFWIFLWIEKNATEIELESRVLLLFINISLLVFTSLLLYKNVLRSMIENQLTKLANYLLGIFIFLLLVAVGSNFYGSVLLSSRIVDGVVSTLYSAMIFYALYVVLTGYIVVILRRRIASASNMLDIYSENIEKTTSFLIKVWMLSWWLVIILKKTSLYHYLLELKGEILSFSFVIAETTISINAIFDFILIVLGTWALARLTQTILKVEVFSRFKLPRGAPTAILTTLNYVIIISGTIIAFSSLGVTPQQFTLVFGALGVGIGFGLRNIIANFVSGIIMVFERPIQIGDTIEVDKTMGTVHSIGARSSTVKTFDGSEVIIPNADFIAKEITNWTLSDEHRRKTLEFKVDLDNDIEKILKIMQEIAEGHKDVLSDPKPLATFKSFGEYYLEFKLYFWLSENLIVAQSEVNILIYKALKEERVKMPVPKTNLLRGSNL